MGKDKVAQRSHYLSVREAQSASECQRASSLIVSRFLSSSLFQRSSSLLLYASFRKEVSTTHLLEAALREGKSVYLPGEGLEQGQPLIYPLLKTEWLRKGRSGIALPVDENGNRTPACRYCDIFPDVVVLPGVAFDLSGARIGYGGGFYDRLLQERNKETTFVALAYQCQISQEMFPVENHDVPVDMIFTEERIVYC